MNARVRTPDPSEFPTKVEQSQLAYLTNIKSGTSLLQSAQQKKDQAKLDSYYQEAVEFFKNSVGKLNTDAYDHQDRKRTILFYAIACFQSADTIQSLINQGSNPREVYYDEETSSMKSAFFMALDLNNIPAVEVLLRNNKEFITVDTALGTLPIHYAINHDNTAILDALYNAEPLVTKICVSATQFTPLHFAINLNSVKSVEWLLTHDKQICDHPDIHGCTPLHLAVKLQRLDLINLLVAHKVKLDAANNEKLTPLHLATALGNNEIVRILFLADAKLPANHAPIHVSKLDLDLQIVFKIDQYIHERTQQGTFKNDYSERLFGRVGADMIKNIASKLITIPTQDNKVDAAKKIRFNILHQKPLYEGMSDIEKYSARESGLGEIVKPLDLERKSPSPQPSPKHSPSISQETSPSSPRITRGRL